VRGDLLSRFRAAEAARRTAGVPADGPRRTVGQLRALAEGRHEEAERAAAAERARQEAERQRLAAEERTQYLKGLAGRAEQVWGQVEALAQSKSPKNYDEAVRLLRD